MPRAPLLIALVLLAPLSLAGTEEDLLGPQPAPPAGVASALLGDDAVVAWLPGPGVAESFNVYGVRDGSLVFLQNTPTTAVTVPPFFGGYAVTAVVDEMESMPTYGLPGPCVEVESLVPPEVDLETDCGSIGTYGHFIIPKP